ncbi:hypothetical protein FB554_1057 [Barrientosiimonas humi]|uniref:Uncharacterized protein n=1 Tax=Barrientosiimonas humi TaxID=999931 RepID=A0A542XAW7_9MICO|nr:hypothetical protein [Barrientosiimonas humi]TQL32924.1 hypothetical protein FB554_1057 [Barrientosiimonas humi]CAG7572914.1 hypothetical protein BH39T_PBIAJDOK_01538 [Barrientosiimonas humi]
MSEKESADRDAVSSVADEAVRLVSALAALGGDLAGSREHPAGADPAETDPLGGDDSAPGGDAAAGPVTCGCSNDAVSSVCGLCPVCRVATFVAEVQPETIEKVADLVSMVAGSLQSFAAQRRAEQAGTSGDKPPAADDDEQS